MKVQQQIDNLQTKKLDTFRNVSKFITWTNKLAKMTVQQSNAELSKYDDESLRSLRNIMNNMIN